jgi:hypothetical protein
VPRTYDGCANGRTRASFEVLLIRTHIGANQLRAQRGIVLRNMLREGAARGVARVMRVAAIYRAPWRAARGKGLGADFEYQVKIREHFYGQCAIGVRFLRAEVQGPPEGGPGI